jgi:prevent-host-death family protein
MAIARTSIIAKIAYSDGADHMQTMSAKDAKNSFGLLLDRARAEPVQVEKHGRPVVVVVSVEEFQRLSLASAAPLGRTGS